MSTKIVMLRSDWLTRVVHVIVGLRVYAALNREEVKKLVRNVPNQGLEAEAHGVRVRLRPVRRLASRNSRSSM